ncbi:MAG: hypothetical protein M3155_07845 [Actinomycetota bacterium]|nr:hypothetical protein [Actinomycetota bacterium]
MRVFAMQFKQEVRNVTTYAAFRTKIECLIREDVVPRLAAGRPNVVAFTEDVGLATLATGSRGQAARAIAQNPAGASSCEPQGLPCATAAALAAMDAGYGKELGVYRARFPTLSPVSGVFVAATDTFVRGFMQTFSDMARRYGVYILGSNDQAPFRESSDPADIAAFADPDLPRPDSVYVATDAAVYNEVFMWGPQDVRAGAPLPLRNLVASNKKVPLTPLEDTLQFTPGPTTGSAAVDNVRPYAIPGTQARLAFATSLPAFVYGDPPAGTDPCSDVSSYYMRCLDRLGANVVIQDEANPGRWTGADGNGIERWQPLSWMASTWRAVSDPGVGFSYNVTPMMTGHLADLVFDGQSAITQRGLRGPGCHYVGNASFVPGEDQDVNRPYAGPKSQFLAIAPWVTPDAPRAALRATGDRLAPGSGDSLENDYVETAIAADLTFPPDPERGSCATSQAVVSLPAGRIGLAVRPSTAVAGRRTRLRFSVFTSTTGPRRPLAGAQIQVAGRSLRSDGRGHATVLVRFARPGRYRAIATKPGLRRGIATVRVRPPQGGRRGPRFTG